MSWRGVARGARRGRTCGAPVGLLRRAVPEALALLRRLAALQQRHQRARRHEHGGQHDERRLLRQLLQHRLVRRRLSAQSRLDGQHGQPAVDALRRGAGEGHRVREGEGRIGADGRAHARHARRLVDVAGRNRGVVLQRRVAARQRRNAARGGVGAPLPQKRFAWQLRARASRRRARPRSAVRERAAPERAKMPRSNALRWRERAPGAPRQGAQRGAAARHQLRGARMRERDAPAPWCR